MFESGFLLGPKQIEIFEILPTVAEMFVQLKEKGCFLLLKQVVLCV
jgi:hypothetical protein